MGSCQSGAFHFVVFLSVILTACVIEIDAKSEGGLGDGYRPWDSRQREESYARSLQTPPHEPTERNRKYFSPLSSAVIPGINARGGAVNILPAGYNPFGYGLTDLGRKYLEFNGSLESDVGQFLSTLKSGKRKTSSTLKEQWLEIVRVSKKGQSMRIYKGLDGFIDFCLRAGFID